MSEAVSPLLQMYESYLRALLNDELPTLTFKVDKHFYRAPKVGVGAVSALSALGCLQHVGQVGQHSALGHCPACLRWVLRDLKLVLVTGVG